MKLSVKGPDGKIEVFEKVDNWSFSILHHEVLHRFNLKCDFALFFGSRELPVDDTELLKSDLGFVSGDRLRLVVSKDKLSSADVSGSSSEVCTRTGNSSSDNTKEDETVFEIVLDEMKQEGFERVEQKDDGRRWTFRHSESVLLIEIDFRVYNDRLVKYVHVTASIYHPSGRQFLEPVVLEDGSNDLKDRVSECLVSPLKLALFGHENPLLRLLGIGVIAEHLFEMLDARSLLRLERTNKYALKLCRSQNMERIWRVFCERDFGKNAGVSKKETYREAYKRFHILHVRDLTFLRNLLEPDYHFDVAVRPTFPNPTYGQIQPDPDVPEGPFQPASQNPYMPPPNPFPLPRPGNPLDPFSGTEFLPNRPLRPMGTPRMLPRSPRTPNQGSMYRNYI
ncbi:unnamed protein product [Litomosoides sigmodontis]|uniref:Uncharacterized protein n=1 Tax=Litomosoides sigmodontis TaxID=42156 RepID=A0A3P6T1W9_LITSI|nr:unnamed protein product [Litomosoides sigmodontis]